MRPDLVQVTTRYFWARWAPRLGPRATTLLLALRRRCYVNPETGESRDWCAPTQEDLAAELGCERKAILRALARLERAGLIRRSPTYTKTWARGSFGVSRRADRISVLLAEPLAPEDEGLAAGLEAERIANAPRGDCGEPVDNSAKRCDDERCPVDNFHAIGGRNPVSRLIADKSPFGTHHAVPLRDSNTLNGKEESNTLPPFRGPIGPNGRRTKALMGREAQGPLRPPPPRLAGLVIDLEQRLGDQHSRGFFVRLAQRMPHDEILAALAEACIAVQEGRARISASAYFTGIIKRRALELGLSLTGGRL